MLMLIIVIIIVEIRIVSGDVAGFDRSLLFICSGSCSGAVLLLVA